MTGFTWIVTMSQNSSGNVFQICSFLGALSDLSQAYMLQVRDIFQKFTKLREKVSSKFGLNSKFTNSPETHA